MTAHKPSQAGVTNLKKLVEHLLPLPPREGQGAERAPEQAGRFRQCFET